MKKILFLLLFCLSCTGTIYFQTGALSINASALVANDITRMTVTITGTSIPEPIVYPLVQEGTSWVGIIDDIPVGSVVVTADGYDGSDVKLYSGSNTATISAGSTASVSVLLQQVAEPVHFNNTPPAIDSLIASSNAVKPSGVVSLSVTAHDPDGDALSYLWSATGGSFNNTASTTPTWTAPTTPGNYTITVTVIDSKNTSRSASLVINVDNKNTGGSIDIIIDINTSPTVASVTAIPGRINVNETTQLSLSASDADGDPLNYSWVSNCGGSFNSGSISNPTWTAPGTLPPSGTCLLSCTVTDGQGGSNVGAITIYVAPPDPFNLAPYLTSSYQQKTSVAKNGNVKFSITAKDPENQSMTFAWSATVGTVGVPTNTATTSSMTWTAPNVSGPAVITVTVTDAGGAQLVKTFNVTVN